MSRLPDSLSRRHLLLGTAGIAILARTRPALADASASIPATNLTKLKLYLTPGASGKPVATIPANSALRVLAGPDSGNWYLVDDGPSASATPGWTSGDNLIFTQHAKIAWDAGVFAGATDAAGWTGSLRHNLVVTVAGPPTNGFSWIRYGNLAGFTYTSALNVTDEPLTDANAEWWVDANRSTVSVNLMIGQTQVDSFPASMSSETGDGFYSTAVGTWWIYEKVEGLQFTPYANAYFMDWAGFDPNRFNGFHSWTMDANGYVLNGGWGNTGGCISTEPKHAATIYNFVQLGTRTEIHW